MRLRLNAVCLISFRRVCRIVTGADDPLVTGIGNDRERLECLNCGNHVANTVYVFVQIRVFLMREPYKAGNGDNPMGSKVHRLCPELAELFPRGGPYRSWIFGVSGPVGIAELSQQHVGRARQTDHSDQFILSAGNAVVEVQDRPAATGCTEARVTALGTAYN